MNKEPDDHVRDFLHLAVDNTGENARPSFMGHIMPDEMQRAYAIDALKSGRDGWLGQLVGLVELEAADPDKTEVFAKLDELSAEATVNDDPSRVALLDAMTDFGWTEWNYVNSALNEGEDSRIWDTTHWIVANAMARIQADQQPPLGAA